MQESHARSYEENLAVVKQCNFPAQWLCCCTIDSVRSFCCLFSIIFALLLGSAAFKMEFDWLEFALLVTKEHLRSFHVLLLLTDLRQHTDVSFVTKNVTVTVNCNSNCKLQYHGTKSAQRLHCLAHTDFFSASLANESSDRQKETRLRSNLDFWLQGTIGS